jgi:hypothetical protein
MGIELPGELTEPLGWIGLIWPQADEDKLFEAGQTWISYGSTLRAQAQQADATAQSVWGEHEGAAIDAFRTWWTAHEGPGANLPDNATAAELIGAGLIVMAGITLALKILFIAQLIILAIEVAQAIATAFATFGATTAEIPGFVAATRAICREALDKVISMVEKEIARLFEQAAKLFERVGAKDLARGTERLADRQSGALRALLSDAEHADVSTPLGKASLYSGEDDAGKRMFDYAKSGAESEDGKILETTTGGKQFDDMGLYKKGSPLTPRQADQVWQRLSSRYAEDASGDVTAYLHQAPGAKPLSQRIFMTRELPALRNNPNVTGLRIIDPTGETRYLPKGKF